MSVSAGWTAWATHPNKKQYRALNDDQGAVLCLQWNNEDGPYTDARAKKGVNKHTVRMHEARLNLDATPRSESNTQLERSTMRSSEEPMTSTGFQIRGPSLSTPYVAQPQSTGDPHAPDEQSEPLNGNSGAQIFRELVATEGLTSNKYYQVHHARFFVRGRVFRTPWSEPRGVTDQQGGDKAYETLRPMVVIRQLGAHCLCLPVYSNQGQGVAKPGLTPSEIAHHAILHMSDTEPQLTKDEKAMKREPNMRDPFPVQAAQHSTLDKASRIRFDMVYTVRYNLRVRDLGRVDPEHLGRLNACWRAAMSI